MKMLGDPNFHVTIFKAGMDFSASGIAIGSLAGYLPPAAAALTVIWVVIQLTEWGFKKYRQLKRR